MRERFYGAFRRSITLPEGTRRDQIQAGFDDGLVEIVVDGVGERTQAASRIELRDRSSARDHQNGELSATRPSRSVDDPM